MAETKEKNAPAAQPEEKETTAAQPEMKNTPATEPKKVKIKLFKDNGRYSGDVFVGVNGRTYLLKRGVELEVPPEVAEVLAHSELQDSLTAERIAQAEAQLNKGHN